MYIDLLDGSLKYLIQIGRLWDSAVKYFLMMTVDQVNTVWLTAQFVLLT